jgi:hypothetical protein
VQSVTLFWNADVENGKPSFGYQSSLSFQVVDVEQDEADGTTAEEVL